MMHNCQDMLQDYSQIIAEYNYFTELELKFCGLHVITSFSFFIFQCAAYKTLLGSVTCISILLSSHLRLGSQILGPVEDHCLGLLHVLLVSQVLLLALIHLGPAIRLHRPPLQTKRKVYKVILSHCRTCIYFE